MPSVAWNITASSSSWESRSVRLCSSVPQAGSGTSPTDKLASQCTSLVCIFSAPFASYHGFNSAHLSIAIISLGKDRAPFGGAYP